MGAARTHISTNASTHFRESIAVLLAAFAVVVWSAASSLAAPLDSVLIRDVPFVKQKPDFCGEACVEMYLRKLKVDVDQDYVFDQSGLDPVLGRGCYTRELAQALRQIGFKTGPVWSEFPAHASKEKLAEAFARLHADLAAGVPSIVCMHYLCYYLQERGLLVKFYHAFQKNVATDRTGYRTLMSILDEEEPGAFRKQWEKFVLGLRFDD
jgi:hypothetical protein